MANRWADHRLFLKQFLRNFQSTGAILPSGPSLAAALAKRVYSGQPKRVLEVGPGTGAVTQHIVRRLGPDDRFVMVELNDDFVRHLRQRFTDEPCFQAVAERCEVVHGRLEELPESEQFDVIVSCLPLNNFPVPLVEQILAQLRRLLRPGGTLSFFEYMAVRNVKSLIASGEEKERIRGISRAIGSVLKEHAVACDWIWPNVPPAWVHHVRFDEPEPQDDANQVATDSADAVAPEPVAAISDGVPPGSATASGAAEPSASAADVARG